MSKKPGAKVSLYNRCLNGVERVGNKLPHPVVLFAILALAIVILSAVCAAFGVSATGELVSGGKLLLLDEPESALDFRHRYRMLDLLRSWAAQEQRCALVALHDPALALECCDQLLLLDERKVLRILRPAEDDLSGMEMTLSRIYGKISLVKCPDRTGREHLVMLKEQEEPR